MRFPYTASDRSITVFLNGVQKVISSDHAGFAAVSEHLKGAEHDANTLLALMDKEVMVSRLTSGSVTVHGGTVYFKGVPIHNTLSIKLVDMLDQGYDATPWAAFMDNLMQNPSENSKEQLYDFLTAFNAPFTEDGCFIVFKMVREDYMDIYTGTFDNSPGKVVEMPREQVIDDPNRTCSAGLHVCSIGYLPSGYGRRYGRTIAVKVNPMDVVSVPVDYNNAKMRVCKYEVLGDISREDSDDGVFTEHQVANAPVLNSTDFSEPTPTAQTQVKGGSVYDLDKFEIRTGDYPKMGGYAFDLDRRMVGRVVRDEIIEADDPDHPEYDNWINEDDFDDDRAIYVYGVDFGSETVTYKMYDDEASPIYDAEPFEHGDVFVTESDDDSEENSEDFSDPIQGMEAVFKIDTDRSVYEDDWAYHPESGLFFQVKGIANLSFDDVDHPQYDDWLSGDTAGNDIEDVEGYWIEYEAGTENVLTYSDGGPYDFHYAERIDAVPTVTLTARDGQVLTLTEKEFRDELTEHGQRGFDRKYNVPRTTVQDTLNRLS